MSQARGHTENRFREKERTTSVSHYGYSGVKFIDICDVRNNFFTTCKF